MAIKKIMELSFLQNKFAASQKKISTNKDVALLWRAKVFTNRSI